MAETNTKKKLAEIAYHWVKSDSLDELKKQQAPSIRLLEELSSDFEIRSFKFSGFETISQQAGLQVQVFKTKLSRWALPFLLHRQIKAWAPDLIWVHGLNNYFRLMHLRFVLGRKTKILVQHHGEMPLGFFKNRLLKLSAAFTDVFLFTSAQSAEVLGLPQHKVKLLMEGSSDMRAVDKDLARSQLKWKPENRIYLWVGRLTAVKDPLFFLQAFVSFARSHPQVQLIMIYQDETLLKACQQITSGTENIVFAGKLNHGELALYYSAADYFVSSSVHEGSGYALCEAMACGLIPLVPDIGAFRFMCREGHCALMYISKDAESLRETPENSLRISNQKDLQEKVLRQFSEELSCQAIASKFKTIVSTL